MIINDSTDNSAQRLSFSAVAQVYSADPAEHLAHPPIALAGDVLQSLVAAHSDDAIAPPRHQHERGGVC
jgi:hypothetical protein